MNHTEQWTHVPGDEWKGKYLVSDMGRVYSTYASKVMTGGRVVPKEKDRGYRQICFSRGSTGPRKPWLIHRLVAASFMPHLYTDECDVHHINGNPSDNRLQNLLIITPEEHDILHREMELARRRVFKAIIEKHRTENGGDQMPLVPLVQIQKQGRTLEGYPMQAPLMGSAITD